jgi:hypothetical protein
MLICIYKNACRMDMLSFENEYAKCWIKEGILFFAYKEGVRIDINAAKKIIEARAQFQNDRYYPLLTDIRGVSYFEKPARDYFATEGTRLIRSTAILVGSPMSVLIARFYLSINKPAIPTQIFTNRDEALKYLSAFV